MTIHGPGSPIYMSEIAAEFGGAPPYYLSQYYAGGGRVPAGATGYYGAIPASGAISMQQFYGASNYIDVVNMMAGTGGGSTVGYLDPALFASPGFGSVDNNIFAPYGAVIYGLYTDSGGMNLQLIVGGTQPNSGWTNISVTPGAHVATRAAAAYATSTAAVGPITSWIWPVAAVFTAAQPYTVTFT